MTNYYLNAGPRRRAATVTHAMLPTGPARLALVAKLTPIAWMLP